MGQYYNIIIKEKGKETIQAYDRHIDGNYTMAKLMEHSWYLNDMVNAICEKLYHKPSHIAWVGDYANENGDDLELYQSAWGDENKEPNYQMLHKTDFTLNGRYLVNHTKKLVLNCWEYLKDSIKSPTNKDGWIIHPLPLLTALGNGRGGGDYRGINEDKVGSWSWDLLEIVEWEDKEELLKKGYTDYKILFEE